MERQVTANPPEDWIGASAISPDGKYVAYAAVTGLLVRSIDSGETRAIPLPSDFSPAQIWEVRWFPEGGKLLLTRRTSIAEESLWVLPVLGQTAPQRLRGMASEPAISPNGKSVVFLSGPLKGPHGLWISGISGEGAHEVEAAGQEQSFGSPVWSPDGKWIAYLLTKSDGTSVVVRPVEGGTTKTAVSASDLPAPNAPNCSGGLGCLCWPADWRLVFPASTKAEGAQPRLRSLWRVAMDPATGQPLRKPELFAQTNDYAAGSLTTTADGRFIAFDKSRAHLDVYLSEFARDGGLQAAHRFTLENHNSIPEQWTPDSRSLLFDSDRNGKYELFRQPVQGTVAERIVSGSAGDLGGGNGLSPDGAWILYWENTPAGSGAAAAALLMRQPVVGGPPEKVLETPNTDSDFFCPGKAGNACVMNGWDGDSMVFYSLDPLRGKGEQLGKLKVDAHWYFGWAISPDGTRLAVVDHSHVDRIAVLTLADKSWHDVAVEPGWGLFQSVAWTADGKGFVVTNLLPESFEMIRVSLSGKVQLLLGNPQTQWMNRPRPSPDGRYLAYQAQTTDANVWLLENKSASRK
jgi:Tol biopolymer transport system component